MATEIERKFLVTGTAWTSKPYSYYRQGYLNRDKNRTVRIRVADKQAFITIKGLTVGAKRAEYEYPIPLSDGEAMLKLCEPPLIEKKRRIVEYSGLKWEIDEFLGDNAGLVIAEVELTSQSQQIDLPDWIGQEVTDDPRYFNSNLTIAPYTTW